MFILSFLLIFVIILTGVIVQILLGSTTYELVVSAICSLLISMFLIHDAQVRYNNKYICI